jgi:formylglycine-generating enzyme required for sulfatase activity
MKRNYGTLSNRRSGGGGGAWQWVIVGMMLGLFVMALLFVISLAVGFIQLGAAGGPTPTAVLLVITATPAPVTPTVLPTATVTVASVAPMIPSSTPLQATPTLQPVIQANNISGTAQAASGGTPPALTLQPTAVGSTPQTTVANAGNVTPASVSSLLQQSASVLLPVTGSTYTMGTTVNEVIQAVNDCTQRDGGQCQVSYGEDAQPAHQVAISPFQIERTEVTYEQYVLFLNSMGPGSHRTACNGQICASTRQEDAVLSNINFDSSNYTVPQVVSQQPIVNVSWFGADAYCRALGRRLPTEAEWELAARGTQGFIYPWGNTWDPNNAKTNRPRDAAVGSLPVGSYPSGASPFGVLDMAGNVGEWVNDWYIADFYAQQQRSPQQPVIDPRGPVTGTDKVIRGGSWDNPPFFARTVHRLNARPDSALVSVGFRCAADAAPLLPSGASGNSGLNAPTPLPGAANPGTLGVSQLTATAPIGGVPTLPAEPTPASPTQPAATSAP